MTTCGHRSTLVFALFLASTAATAQTSGGGPAGRIVSRLVARLGADPSLPDSLRHWSAADLGGSANVKYVGSFDDTSAVDFMWTMAVTLRQLPDSACAALLNQSGSTPDLPFMLGFTDSVTAAHWATILERLVRLRAARAPARTALGPDDTRQAYTTAIMALPDSDRTRMIQIARQQTSPAPADFCWVTRTTFGALTKLPPQQLAPLTRAMFTPSSGP